MILTACGDSGPDQPQTLGEQFANALNSDDVGAAAALTSDPAQATTAITQMYDGLGKEVQFDVDKTGTSGDDDTITFAANWKLGGGDSPKEWKYTTTATATDGAEGWRITWDPSVLAPFEAGNSGSLIYRATYPKPARVADSAGRDLLTQQVVTLVNVSPTADTAAVAALLTPVAPTVTAQTMQTDLAAAEGKPITPVALREQDATPISAALAAIPGVELVQQTRLLTADRALTSPAFNGLSELWQEANDAAAGWEVASIAPDGTAERLIGEDAKTTPDIATTLDTNLQVAAEAALAPIQQPAAIVAIEPSTGGILGVAQNASADAQGPIALTGLYPPGSTFKTVTASAALQAGTVTPDTVLPCPGTENIEGRQIPNDENFDLGQVPFHTAFARSCNTTLGRLAVALPPDALTKAAAQFGLGVDYVTPGLTTVTGSVPPADTPAERVESGIGQGKVTASPFGMALVASSIANNGVRAPMIVQGKPGTGDKTPDQLPANISSELLTMMRETVTGGTATILNDIPDLRGKTGTAEHGNGPAHGWFVGIVGGVAFAVFVSDADSSGPALEAAGRFLRSEQFRAR
ncbi:penicillin-binding transpeptidase domain-containing protein [Antrihabitans spumae]|uniref:Penicillin-binding transpeptidase domain-containing protein n=1 Tax=Antrihabitans spumae TaxID=3373370 RepID=A0ABW7KJY4_9NOCA